MADQSVGAATTPTGSGHWQPAPVAADFEQALEVPAPQAAPVGPDGKLPLSETLLDRAGAASPFGDDVSFPVPAEHLRYIHPADS